MNIWVSVCGYSKAGVPNPQSLVRGPEPVCGMPKTGPRKQVKPHPQDVGSTQNHSPSFLQINLSLWNRSLVPKSLGMADLEEFWEFPYFSVLCTVAEFICKTLQSLSAKLYRVYLQNSGHFICRENVFFLFFFKERQEWPVEILVCRFAL